LDSFTPSSWSDFVPLFFSIPLSEIARRSSKVKRSPRN
jgi:hypothetical protein